MATVPTFPGVYIQEIPSGVRTITGVATSITAFAGRAIRGPVNTPTTINSYGDFERIFGGLWTGSPMGFAVRDFFLNGGAQAIIVRVFAPDTTTPATLTIGGLVLNALSPGTWGNSLRARVDYHTADDPTNVLFNLSVRDDTTLQVEQFRNASVQTGHPRQVDKIVGNSSQLVSVGLPLPGSRPTASPDPSAGSDPWSDTNSTKVQVAGQSSDGNVLTQADFTGTGKLAAKHGLYALENADLFNILCIPPHKFDAPIETTLVSDAAAYCETRRAFLIVDPQTWASANAAATAMITPGTAVGTSSRNAAVFFPSIREPNSLHQNTIENFAPCGAVAGIFARTDATRGVWKAPAGLDATLTGVVDLSLNLTDGENGQLNPLGVNCLRIKAGVGPVVWGSRTLQGSDRVASEWKYIPVRRLALFLEESLYRGTQWVVFEPNDEPLWAQIRLNVGAFMQNLFRQGAFQGTTPSQAYFVKCDKETTTQNDINLGIVNIVVGFAPLKPAEFVIIQIQQMAGQVGV
jgi:phage tail sheath protein FI